MVLKMIIDMILDRMEYEKSGYLNAYDPKKFYDYCMFWNDMPAAQKITFAMDYCENNDIQKALCDYIVACNYNKNICKYINSVTWI